MFENSKWIWAENFGQDNEYAEFCQKINYESGKTFVKFSVSGEYTLFVNGKYVKSVQYADFEHYKVYENVDITPYLGKGENYVHGFEDYSSLEMIFDELDDINIDDLPKSDVVIYSSQEIEEYLLNNLEE